MEERRNHYRVLHLQPDAPIDLVRVNYLTLMQKLNAHPDLGGEHWSAVHLNVAYSTLSNPAKRAEYDQELLARHDIETLSLGRFKPTVDRKLQLAPHTSNRRNYYRLLQVQREAPLEILEASYHSLRGKEARDAELLDQAFQTLKDPKRRSMYDRLLTRHGHQNALLHMQLEAREAGEYQPVITSYCAFCKTPHARSEESEVHALCDECQSPLFPPPQSLLGLARRAVGRAQRNELLTIHLGWPEPRTQGRVLDLSPTGMRCFAEAPIDCCDVLKVSSPHFDAVGTVAHVSMCEPGVTLGLQFLTVRFVEARGNFMSLKA